MIKLNIYNHAYYYPVKRLKIKYILQNIEKKLKKEINKKYLGHSSGTINLFFVKDNEIKKINKQFRKINKETDVISVSYIESKKFPNEDILGEIFISLDTAKKSAKDSSIQVDQEIEFLFIHGILHIFGYTHETTIKYKKMYSLTEEIQKF